MSHFYTNVALNKGKIYVRGYYNGKRYANVENYAPYMFIPTNDKKSDYHTLFDKPVKKMQFDNVKQARDFVQEHKGISNFEVFGLDKFAYTYIYDKFKGDVKYDPSLIKVSVLDIECASKGGYATPENPFQPITLIGMTVGDERIQFGYKQDLTGKVPGATFVFCRDEREMLFRFLDFYCKEENNPDVISGWHIEGFDIPYLVHRIRQEINDAEARRLSPFGILVEREAVNNGKAITTYVPLGVAVLDYLPLYKKFTYNQQESYTLDHISFIETGKRKLDYSEYANLDELYDKDYPKYCFYNIEDLNRVWDIDAKNKFFELAYAIAYDAKVNYVDALSSVLLWDVIIHNHLMDRRTVIPKFELKDHVDIPGGYVKDVRPGLHHHVISVDVQSEYPHAIMQFNISPETFVDIKPWSDANINNFIYSGYNNEYVKKNNLIQAGNGAYFRKDKVGFLPELMRKMFDRRNIYKKQMMDFKKKNDPALDNEITRLNNIQMALKICLNSAYGTLANKYCRYSDWRLSSAVTLSGQLCIRWIEKHINEWMNELCNTKSVDYVIAIDTDSCYVSFDSLIKLAKAPQDLQKRIDWLDRAVQGKFEPFLLSKFEELAALVNANQNDIFMKRECISDKAIWKAKKMYIMNVWDNEGVRYDKAKIKIMGIEVVRSSTPSVCKVALKNAIELILNKSEAEVIQFIHQFRAEFNTMSFEQIASPRGVRGLSKYKGTTSLCKTGTPIAVGGALLYNQLLRQKKLELPIIHDGEKIKFCYLKPGNPVKWHVIAAPRALPKELALDSYLDYDKQFKATFLEPIDSILNVIGWKSEEISTLDSFFQ